MHLLSSLPLGAAALSWLWGLSAAASTGGDGLAAVAADLWEWQLRESPEDATSLGDHRFDDRLTDLSAEGFARRAAAARALARRLDELGALGPEDAITADVLRLQLAETIDSERLHLEQLAVDQMDGPQVAFPRQMADHPARSERDLANLLARYRAFPAQIDQYVANLRAGLREHRTAPRAVVERVIAQLRERLAGDPATSSFARAGDALPSASEPRRAELRAELAAAAGRHVYPAYRALLAFLEREYLPHARAEVGLCALPGGAEIYAFAIRQRTTTRKTPAELHELGLREVARIEAELRAVTTRLGLAPGRAALEKWLLADRPFQDRASQLAEYRRTVDRFRERLSGQFTRLPSAPLEVEAMPAFMEQHAPGAYYQRASEDGARPATFFVNTWQPEQQPRYKMEALVAHEALPGHHLQISLAQALTGLPVARRRAGVTAFTEGWGMYAERLADEMGLYSDDRARVGMLLAQAMRAARLVVDTGLHAMGWTREQAVEYMLEHSAATRREAETEVDRYVVWPAQGMAYMVGQLEIMAARAEAERIMGARFSRQAFHDRLLASGPMPLETMRRVMAEWARQ